MPAADVPPKRRRRKRDLAAFILGVGTALTVAVGVLAVAVLLLFASGMVPLSGLQHYVARDLQSRLGEGWQVETRKAAIIRQDGRPQLRIQDVEFSHRSGARLRAPEATVHYDAMSLMSGAGALRSIDIRGVTLRLKVDSNGALILDTGESELSWRTGAAPDDALRPETVVGEALAALGADGPLPTLERLALIDSRLQLVAPDGSERAGIERADIVIEQSPEGRTYRFRGYAPSGFKDIAIAWRRAAEGPGEIDLAVNAFQLDDLERLLVGRSDSFLSGFPIKGVLRVRGERQERIEGEFNIGAGKVALGGAGVAPVSLDAIAAKVEADRLSRTLNISDGAVTAGGTRLALAGALAFRDGNAWRVQGTASGTLAGEGADPEQPLARAEASIEGIGVERARLASLTLMGPNLSVSGEGSLEHGPNGPAFNATLTARDSSVRSMLAGWPRMVSPFIRELVADRVLAGQVETLKLVVAMPPDAFAASRRGDVIPDESVKLDITGRGVRFRVGDGIPLLQDLAVSGIATGRTVQLDAPSARIDLGRGRSIALSEGRFAITDTYAARPIGRSAFRAAGNLDALAALMAVPAFKEAAPTQIDPEIIRGRMDLRVNLSLPLVSELKSSEVALQAVGPLTGVASDKLLAPERFEAGNLQANYDRGAITLRGDLRLGGTPATLDLRQDAKGVGEAVVQMTLDQAARERRKLALPGLTGSVGVRGVQALGRGQAPPVRVELDLTRAAIDGVIPGWTKPAGRPGRMSFLLDDPTMEDGAELTDVMVDAPPLRCAAG